jgi:DNA invertase Pin-like site-specific DNA recombinase
VKPSAQTHDGSRRAIGIVRVSQTTGREGERFVSPGEQRDRIESACERDGLTLLAIHQELDVSGGRTLANRPGLSAAVAAIENGEAEVVAAAYFDRLFRSLSTQAEVIERVERAGGSVLAVDVGQVTNGSAGQWLSGTMLGAVSEYFRRSIKERSSEGQARAVARGATPWSRVPIGYVRLDDGTLEPDPTQVPLVRRAFEMRVAGESISQIRNMLKAHGIDRSHRGVQIMLANRVYLGEIHFGQMVNLQAHDAIIDRELYNQVQHMVIPRGPRPGSDRLLARLGVLRCGSCGARLGSMKLPRQNDYPIYRCPSTSDCAHHVTISAVIAEEVVTSAVRAALSDVRGRASLAADARKAASELSSAQDALDAALRSFTTAGLTDEPAAVERLADLRHARDEAQSRVDRLSPSHGTLTINAVDSWDLLTLEERRALIRATVESAIVAPSGRGAGRVSVRLFGHDI